MGQRGQIDWLHWDREDKRSSGGTEKLDVSVVLEKDDNSSTSCILYYKRLKNIGYEGCTSNLPYKVIKINKLSQQKSIKVIA